MTFRRMICSPVDAMRKPQTPSNSFRGPRHSECAVRSGDSELERVRSLSVTQRIKAALTIRKRFAWLDPKPGNP